MAPSVTETLVIQNEQPTTSISDKQRNGVMKKKNVRDLPTFEELRSAIPKECFEKDLKRSLFYLFFDYAAIALLYIALPYVEQYGGWPALFAWYIVFINFETILIFMFYMLTKGCIAYYCLRYWVIGMFMSSLFVVGHDCGHGTFSNYTWINDIFGHVAHAPLMAPYWPWQKSHRQHHQYTSHIDKDRGHPWITEEYYNTVDFIRRHFHKLPIAGFIKWNPIYTLVGLPDGSHFWPFSSLFTNNRERLQCVVSGVACALCSYIAYALCGYSVTGYIKYYYVPLIFQGFWLVMFTYLQHQDEDTEVYEDNMWNFVTGQMQTIDLTYGFGVDFLLHHITDGHVAHHLFFTRIPHYNLPKATKAIRQVLQERYPGVYKNRTCYAYVYDFLRLNIKLDYLISQGNGILKYSLHRRKEASTPNSLNVAAVETKDVATGTEPSKLKAN